MKNRFVTFCLVILTGCTLNGNKPFSASVYDFGPAPVPMSLAIPLRGIEVKGPSWLDSPNLSYRLLYADRYHRASYASSELVAPPAELMAHFLRHALLREGEEMSSGGCMLNVELEEFVQHFETPQSSLGVLEARAALVMPDTKKTIARKNFQLNKPSPSTDAKGGVVALSGTVAEFSIQLRDWLNATGGACD